MIQDPFIIAQTDTNSRFIGGVGGSFGTGPYLNTELAHPQHRAIVTTIYNTCYSIGAIIAAWATYGTLTIQSQLARRLPSLLQIVTPAIQFALIWFVPESPRYLMSKDKTEEAREILKRYHGPCSGPEFIDAEFNEIYQTIQLEKRFAQKGIRELWSSKGNRHRLAICIALGIAANTVGNGILSYYLHQVLDSIGYTSPRLQLRINGAIQVYNWVFSLGVTFFVDLLGRRRLFLISFGGMLCVFVAWTVCSALYTETQGPGEAKGILACIFLYYTFSTTSPSAGCTRPTPARFCRTTSAPRAWPWWSSAPTPPTSSAPTSARSGSPTPGGSTIFSTTAGWWSSLSCSTSCWSRLRTPRWRKSRSSSTVTMRWWAAART